MVLLQADGAAAARRAPPPAPQRSAVPAATPQPAQILTLAYLGQRADTTVVPPYFDPVVTDRGIQGARLGLADDNTTGRFTRQEFAIAETLLAPGDEAEAAFKRLVAAGRRFILADLKPEVLQRLSALPEARDILLLDIASRDDALRGESCAPNVLHLLPSRAMRADALSQYLVKKKWTRWFLAVGPAPEDRLFADALKRSAKRFGMKIVTEKNWEHTFDDRRTPESEVPVFTQGSDYDVLLVADEAGLFGDALLYRTWRPRLVAGTQGLVAAAWHHTLESWGAIQLQNRFREQAGRRMTEVDYGAWLAVRAIGEAATRTRSLEFEAIRAYLLGDHFALAGFKGVPLSFRRWDGQLRQPVLLAQERSLVAVAPVEGFAHPKNELDSLGYDEPETQCRAKK
ncbi:ABC transporter substrate-binding protein [Methylococcus geothermalis]|uniref:ABC transporter substrate-binding protein n=1 Tax=Methylococcus geothermalis TaxID=2681310 RepID=A0A858QCG9_9GAMM|nr:ABC transporter substrate-binding protein [Methylococcus geothermalis]